MTMLFLSLVLLALKAVTAVSALAIEKQQYYNRTVTCDSYYLGGCCSGALDEEGYNPSCYNATLVATNVGGSTMGPRNQYACLNEDNVNGTPNTVFAAFCCKYETVRMNATSNWTFMSCFAAPGDPQ